MADLIDELRWRGLVQDVTSEDALCAHLDAGRRRVYCGFDPTADSLTVGNLVPIMLLRHFQEAGHEPVVVMGGGTGLIGDPSGKEQERQLLTREQVEANIAGQRPIFEQALRFDGENAASIVNNDEWLKDLSYIEALRDIGKHFSVNMMMQKESVRERLHGREQGISYTEFSYMILQAYDFLRLYEDRGVTVQVGGSDQWGNIVAGCDLIRRKAAGDHGEDPSPPSPLPKGEGGRSPSPPAPLPEGKGRRSPSPPAPLPEGEGGAFGLTAPLVTRSDGGKFGKTESGAVWLTAARTSPYAFHQFWLNASDADAPRYLKMFTLLERNEIESILAEHEANPAARAAQRRLAQEVTDLIHGVEAREHAERAAQALFSGDVAHLDQTTLEEVFAEVPSTEHDKSRLSDEGVPLVDLLPETSLANSKREAREHLKNGAVSVNGEKVGPDDRLTEDRLLHGSITLLRRGKKSWHVARWR